MTEKTSTAISDGSLYWDWNSTTPPHASVVKAVSETSLELWANCSSQHQRGRAASSKVEAVREKLASYFSAKHRDVIFTGSGTEANNLALAAALTIVTSRLEHPSIVKVADYRQRAGRAVHWLPVPGSGELCPSQLEQLLTSLSEQERQTTLVCIAAANHETGVIQPIKELSEVVAKYGCALHVDAAQSFGKVAQETLEGRVSFSVVGHKIRGPKGVAALIWKNQPGPVPVLLGGSQERGLRPGTISTPLVVGLGVAVERIDPEGYQALGVLRNSLEEKLAPYSVVHGSQALRLPHVSNLGVFDWTGERLVAALDVRGLCVSTGSACSVGTAEPSAAVEAMLGRDAARASVRISLGDTCTEQELEQGAAIFLRLLSDTEARRSSRKALGTS